MAIKAEGIWGCTVLSAFAGRDDKDNTVVQVNVRIDEGPSTGMRGTYEEVYDNRSAPYVERSCQAIGWAGVKLSTLRDDVAKWITATGGKTTCEVKHLEIKRGKQYDKWVADGKTGDAPVWDKIKSLGKGAARSLRPLEDDAPTMGTPPADAPADSDDIPFITSARVSMGEVAL